MIFRTTSFEMFEDREGNSRSSLTLQPGPIRVEPNPRPVPLQTRLHDKPHAAARVIVCSPKLESKGGILSGRHYRTGA